ncbi:MAG: AAA family ATPase [Candidatus Marinimicrobia bacterium]|jgi:DNA polymerase III delta prime subunit|nr:AAA family ATPase [Candidatus Neomarinimicrobiota bacterium]
MKNNFLWVEKYRPSTIQECVLPSNLKNTFQEYVDQGDFPNLLLSGTAGTGKTTVARALCNELDLDYIVINGSNEGRSIDVLRTTIQNYVTTVSFTGRPKVVILDEADYLNVNSVQPALRNFMEEFSSNARFILTANYANKIIPPLHSRTSVIEFKIKKSDKPKLMGQIMKRLINILNTEGVEVENNSIVAKLIEKHYPDNRRIINELQRHSSGGALNLSVIGDVGNSNLDDLIVHLKGKDFKEMRRWVGENSDQEPDILIRSVYEQSLDLLAPASVPEVIVMMSEYLHKFAFASDPEIHLVAFFAEMMVTAEWKNG